LTRASPSHPRRKIAADLLKVLDRYRFWSEPGVVVGGCARPAAHPTGIGAGRETITVL